LKNTHNLKTTSITPEQFSTRLAKAEADIRKELKIITSNYKPSMKRIEELSNSEKETKLYEDVSKKAMARINTHGLDSKLLSEYIHLNKLNEINRKLMESLNKDGGNNNKKKSSNDQDDDDDDVPSIFTLSQYVKSKPNVESSLMEDERLTIKKRIMKRYKKLIKTPDDLLKQKITVDW